ncbi:two-component response regulator ORR23-like isoform X2 [Dioscorea cayenensis subsp. rotundata]|uniref:Two-component response regulator ORR23-like isoform X2 n=1 Tax=Dioscorea cayennensis subsp. rotundata TaxID=55577 RepID=A0AB40D3E7_DIOCR|nr:two-component response regulator ORR23-like isoform X2 [Dioscorea cayenensis subsp. rotundata]
MVRAIAGSSRRRRRQRNFDSNFPKGMRVMAVDDDLVCLKFLEILLLHCGYAVTATQYPCLALNLLRQNSDAYDLVIIDVQMPDMDGFQLLESIVVEMDIPVIMLSIHSDTKSVTKCIEHGACDYMVKPARFEELKLIWKHVVKKSMSETAFEHPSATAALPLGSGDGSSQASGNDHPDQGKGKENELPANVSDEDSSLVKKARVTWSSDLHAVFVRAVNTVGLDRAGPKRILEVMGVPGLSRQNVASHLQKYRRALRLYGRDFFNIVEGDAGAGASGGADTSGVKAKPQRTMALALTQPVPDNGRLTEDLRVAGFPNNQTAAPVRETPMFSHPMSNQNALVQTRPSTSLGSQQTIRHISSPSYPALIDLTGRQATLDYRNQQSFISTLDQINDYIRKTSQNFLPSSIPPVPTFASGPSTGWTTGFVTDVNSSLAQHGNQQYQSTAPLVSVIPSKQDVQWGSGAYTKTGPSSGAQNNEATLNVDNHAVAPLHGTSYAESGIYLSEPSIADGTFLFDDDNDGDDLHAMLRQFQNK